MKVGPQQYCTHCGQRLEGDGQFCTTCGKPVPVLRAPARPRVSAASDVSGPGVGMLILLLAGGAVLVLLLLTIGAWWWFARSARVADPAASPSDPSAAGETAAGPGEKKDSGRLIQNMAAARDVSEGRPVGVSEVFSPDVEKIHICFELQGVVQDLPLRSVWTVMAAERSQTVAEISGVVPAMSKRGEVHVLRPEGGWPVGTYEVTFFAHDQSVGVRSFRIAAAGDTPGEVIIRAPEGEEDPPQRVAEEPIGPGGGTVTVQAPGNQLDGMAITVPAGAYADGKTFRVSHRAATGFRFGRHVHLLSPLITVENGGAYAAQAMTVRVPVRVPPGHFAMPFFCDVRTGKLEGIPMIAADAGSVTFLTRHFSTIVVASAEWKVIEAALPVDTGFKPGTDDWQFTNYGSYASPGGHCAGQSISAMWYYYERRLRGGRPLYGQFDNDGADPTPTFWYDDARGYKLASMVQEDINWSTQYRKEAKALAEASPDLVWGCFVYSMLVTGDPQYVGIARFDAQGNRYGHALVAYKADREKLYIADPNYPGTSLNRAIPRRPGRLGPYVTGQNAKEIKEGKAVEYTQIGYYAKTALVPWGQIGQRWDELAQGTIGTGRFPEYDLVIVRADGTRIPFTDNYTTGERELTVDIDAGSPPISLPWKPALGLYSFMDGDWSKKGRTVMLRPGINRIGIMVWAAQWNNKGELADLSWAQFAWRTVNAFALTVEPAEPKGVAGEPVALTARYQGTVKSPRFEWLFGDGRPWTRSDGPGVAYAYRTPGTYELMVRLYDDETGKLIADGRAQVVVGEERPAVAQTPTRGTRPADTPKPQEDGAGWEEVFSGTVEGADFPRSLLPPNQVNHGAWESYLRPIVKERTTKVHQLRIPQSGRLVMTVKVTGKFDTVRATSTEGGLGRSTWGWHEGPASNGGTVMPTVQAGSVTFTVNPSQTTIYENMGDRLAPTGIRVLPCSYEIRVQWKPK